MNYDLSANQHVNPNKASTTPCCKGLLKEKNLVIKYSVLGLLLCNLKLTNNRILRLIQGK